MIYEQGLTLPDCVIQAGIYEFRSSAEGAAVLLKAFK